MVFSKYTPRVKSLGVWNYAAIDNNLQFTSLLYYILVSPMQSLYGASNKVNMDTILKTQKNSPTEEVYSGAFWKRRNLIYVFSLHLFL